MVINFHKISITICHTHDQKFFPFLSLLGIDCLLLYAIKVWLLCHTFQYFLISYRFIVDHWVIEPSTQCQATSCQFLLIVFDCDECVSNLTVDAFGGCLEEVFDLELGKKLVNLHLVKSLYSTALQQRVWKLLVGNGLSSMLLNKLLFQVDVFLCTDRINKKTVKLIGLLHPLAHLILPLLIREIKSKKGSRTVFKKSMTDVLVVLHMLAATLPQMDFIFWSIFAEFVETELVAMSGMVVGIKFFFSYVINEGWFSTFRGTDYSYLQLYFFKHL